MSTVKTEVHDISETRKKISVDVAAAEIANIRKQLIKEFQREANVPGFRPGKVPENIILMRYDKELKSELAKRVINMAFQDGVAPGAPPFAFPAGVNGDSPPKSRSSSFSASIISLVIEANFFKA